MESRTNFHPVYVSGQYLTNEHLNETQNFLWQEEKASRYLLAGNGIAQGLKADFEGTTVLLKIVLSKGTASTIDGFLIQTEQDIKFDRAISLTLVKFSSVSGTKHIMDKTAFEKIKDTIQAQNPVEVNVFEIFNETTPENAVPEGTKRMDTIGVTAADALANFLLLSYVDISDQEYNQCQQGDCNSKGAKRNYKVRYFLVNNTNFPQINSVGDELLTASTARIKNLSGAGSKDGLHQRSFEAWSASFAELLPYFSENTNRKLQNVTALLALDDQKALVNSINKFVQINQSVNNKNCPQYYSLFASDLVKAINELVVFYNDYSKKYPSISTDRIERAMIAGSLRSSGVDKWRYYFVPATELLQSQFESYKLKMLFRRVLALVDNFIPQASIIASAGTVKNKPLAVPTLVGDSLLQNRSIPYYYDITTLTGTENNVLKYWNPQGGSLKNIYSYYDTTVLGRTDMANKLHLTDWYNQNFFRIEGHVGMNKQTAITALTSLIRTQGLPIQLIDCDVNYKGPQKWINWYQDFVNNLGIWVTNLRKDYKAYDFRPIKKIQDTITQTSYRSIEDVSKVFNDFTAYSGVFYNPPPPPPPNARGNTARSGIPADAYTKFTQVVKKTDVELFDKNYREALAEQTELQARKLVVLSDLTDLEYNGGAPRGGTFVLLHDGTNVIGDGSLPYYYRVNLSRTYNI